MKELKTQPGDLSAKYTFNFTNVAPYEVTITRVSTSCGCTTAKLPTLPWKIAAGTNGQFEVEVDIRSRFGTIEKFITVETDRGTRMLGVKAMIPEPQPQTSLGQDRVRNLLSATADRQSVFKNDCVECHVKPLAGKTDVALFTAACGICHEAEHRATMVPDLHTVSPGVVKDAAYWKNWITNGKEQTLMPAFSKASGGPLDDAQIAALAELLSKGIPAKPAH